MGRSIPTNEPAVSYPSLIADTSMRLQQLVNGWRGAERGEPLTALHNACVNAVGPGGRHLVPAHVIHVTNLDATNLQIALNHLTGKGQAPSLRFRVRPGGRFDAVLVPTRSVGDVPQGLKALRGGIGETYRLSLQAILAENVEGLTFAQVVRVLRERQGHDVHRGTVRTLLYAGGFVQRGGCWFAAPQSEVGARKLRAALVETLVAEESEEVSEDSSEHERRLKRVKAIRGRLGELVGRLRENMCKGE